MLLASGFTPSNTVGCGFHTVTSIRMCRRTDTESPTSTSTIHPTDGRGWSPRGSGASVLGHISACTAPSASVGTATAGGVLQGGGIGGPVVFMVGSRFTVQGRLLLTARRRSTLHVQLRSGVAFKRTRGVQPHSAAASAVIQPPDARAGTASWAGGAEAAISAEG